MQGKGAAGKKWIKLTEPAHKQQTRHHKNTHKTPIKNPPVLYFPKLAKFILQRCLRTGQSGVGRAMVISRDEPNRNITNSNTRKPPTRSSELRQFKKVICSSCDGLSRNFHTMACTVSRSVHLLDPHLPDAHGPSRQHVLGALLTEAVCPRACGTRMQ